MEQRFTVKIVAPSQHFHFWCLRSNRRRRGFSPRKDALRWAPTVQSRSENAL